ncbi:MAG TPA: rod shape-determining protein RodA [Allosphingosinicella sp.]
MALPLVPRTIAEQPWPAIFGASILAGLGFITLYSAAGGKLMPWALPHGMRFGVFLVLALALSYVRPAWWKETVVYAFVGNMVLLIVVLGVGVVGGGARSWLDFGPIRLQPSELMKPILVIALATFYTHMPPRNINTLGAIWPAAAMIGVPVVVILLQPDLGTSLLLTFSGITTMFLAGLPLRWFIGGGLVVGGAIPAVFPFLMEHQQERILILLDPAQDPLGAGYHITQSKIAIGSGGITGQGFLNGTQSHLQFLPEQHTDFIFSALAEEWGLVGGIFVLLWLGVLLWWGMRVAMRARGRFEKLLAAGLTSIIFFYAAINLMMVVGLAPVVGIPLPLVSWGGSSMMTVMICLGLLMGIDRQNRREARRA